MLRFSLVAGVTFTILATAVVMTAWAASYTYRWSSAYRFTDPVVASGLNPQPLAPKLALTSLGTIRVLNSQRLPPRSSGIYLR